MGSNRIELCDISKKAREVVEWRAQRRQQLREEYLRKVHHPIKQEVIIEKALERFRLVRLTHQYQAKVTGKSFLVGLVAIAIGFYTISYTGAKIKQRERNIISSGLVSYADREFKFV